MTGFNTISPFCRFTQGKALKNHRIVSADTVLLKNICVFQRTFSTKENLEGRIGPTTKVSLACGRRSENTLNRF